jgi:uncharacterized protein (UPF0332 family)
MAATPFNWSNYLTLAITLSGNADEASHRSSISRAYYSVYHTASDRATSLGYVPPGWSQHAALWSHYQSRSDNRCKKLGAIGLRMKRRRVQADYHANAQQITANVPNQIADANNFLNRLQSLPAHLPNP